MKISKQFCKVFSVFYLYFVRPIKINHLSNLKHIKEDKTFKKMNEKTNQTLQQYDPITSFGFFFSFWPLLDFDFTAKKILVVILALWSNLKELCSDKTSQMMGHKITSRSQWVWWNFLKNTSLVALGALAAHHMQCRTVWKIQNGHQGSTTC